MNWTQILIAAIMTGTLSTFLAYIFTKRKRHVETDSASLANMEKVYSLLREEYDRHRKRVEIDFERNENKIERLEKIIDQKEERLEQLLFKREEAHKREIEKLELKIHKLDAIAEEFRRCSFYIEKGKCPVKEKKFADIKPVIEPIENARTDKTIHNS
jgi:ATPase subunit of ABC transporter with duplicated ATPase domains